VVFAFPPPFLRRLVPCAFRVRHYRGPPVFRRPAAHTGAGALSRYRSAAPGPQCGFPSQASLSLTRPCRLIPSAVPSEGSQASMVMRTGYRASNGTQVVAAFTPSANFMFCIYRGPLHPLWVGTSQSPPALRSLPPPPLPRTPPLPVSICGPRPLVLAS